MSASKPLSEDHLPDLPECADGPEAKDRFKDALRQVLSVPKEELERREMEWRKSHPTKTRKAKPAV
jgi:hypothetical protein